MAISLINKNIDLPMLSIEAAEELERLRLKKDTDLKNVKELSILIKEDFANRLDYSQIFKQAYHSTYSESITNINRKIGTITQRLESRLNLKDKELKELVNFCVNLSDYSFSYEQYLESLRGPCF